MNKRVDIESTTSPRTLRSLKLFSLACTADASSESTERDDLFVLRDGRQIGVCLGELHAYDNYSE